MMRRKLSASSRTFTTMLSRKAICLVLAFLAMALVTWALARNSDSSREERLIDCGVVVDDTGGTFHALPCP